MKIQRGLYIISTFFVLVSVLMAGCAQRTTKTTISTLTTTTAQSGNGLQLQVSVNAAILTQGEPLQINISDYNTLPTNNNVAAATNWGVNGLTIGACPNINVLPFGVAVFQGHYDARNISQGTPLELFEAVPCVQLIRLITGYDFLPNSSKCSHHAWRRSYISDFDVSH